MRRSLFMLVLALVMAYLLVWGGAATIAVVAVWWRLRAALTAPRIFHRR